MVGSMRSNRGDVTHLPANKGGIKLRFYKDGRVEGRTPPNRDGVTAEELEYSGTLDEFGNLALIEVARHPQLLLHHRTARRRCTVDLTARPAQEQNGKVCRFDGNFTEEDDFSSFCG